jgi:hypothetical protein
MNNNGDNAQSDLGVVLEKVAPQRRAEFLQWRERLKRYGENDEILALSGYLDAVVTLVDAAARQAQPEAVAKALNQVVQASRDQATAVARYPRWNYALNTTILILIAVLGTIIGAGIVGGVWYLNHEARTKTPEYGLARDVKTIGGGLKYSTSPNGDFITLTVLNPAKLHPGQTSWVTLRPSLDGEGNAVVMLYDSRSQPK